jgi:hypothetical protein
MTPNRNKTLTGLPRVVVEIDHEPFTLWKVKRSGVVPVGTIPRDTRGTQGPVPVHIPPARRAQTQRAEPAPTLALPLEHIAAAFIVTALVSLFFWFAR